MQLPTIPKKFPTFAKFNQMSKKHRITVAGAVAATAVVLTVTGLEATAGAGSATAASQTGVSASAGTQHAKDITAPAVAAKPKAQPKTDLAAQAKKKAADAAAEKKAAAQANERARAKAAANRSEHRAPVAKKSVTKKSVTKRSTAPRTFTKHYTNNLDGWIRQSLDILHKKGIPGTYEGIHRNIIRESSGNPHAINLWDINARNGIPSKGLLQVIDPTFQRYHVSGTSENIYDPVANITAACNYAADRYGSMDNVNSAY
jgi:transglycosylase-like protein with SLT domain